MTLIVDERELHEAVAATLRQVFGLGRVTFFLRDGDGTPFRVVSSRGVDDEQARTAEFAADGRLARWLRVNEAPLVLEESPGIVAFLDEAERRTLERLGAAACFPLVAMNRLTGFLAVGPTDAAAGFGLSAAERELLSALAGQATLAIENAALLREQKARLKRMYRAERLATAGELAAGAAHEIRNPLTAIRSVIQYLRTDYPAGSERAGLIDEVLAEVDRIDGIVEGLLSFARPAEARFERVDLVELLRHGIALVSARARAQRVATELALPDSLQVHADPNLLKQLLLNVFLNALQAMPGGGVLRLAADLRGGIAEIRATDTGCGIAPEHVERIFDPFFTTKRDGTGLGLSTSYGIVERHGGELEVESAVGRGTTIRIRLPQRQRR